MKKILIICLILSTLITTLWIGYIYFQIHKYPIYDTSQLKPLNVDGIDYKTTGAIPNQDVSAYKTLDEVIQLELKSPINSKGYQITVEGQGNVVIKLKTPYDQNKNGALEYLKTNGFGDIPQNTITWINK